MTDRHRSPRGRQRLVHSLRVLLFVVTLGLIHHQFGRLSHSSDSVTPPEVNPASLRAWFAQAESLDGTVTENGSRAVLDADGEVVGTLQHTSPGSDHVVGFSGPTNVRIGLTPDDHIAGIEIVSSFDTPEHVQQVLKDDSFLPSFVGRSRQDVVRHSVDGVSGATLTSMAVQESVIHALSGRRTSLRFPQPLTPADVRQFFETAKSLREADDESNRWLVIDAAGEVMGSVLRTSPSGDNIIGYQGPTDTLVAVDEDDRIIGIQLLATFDNEPYTDWVRDEESFRALYRGRFVEELADSESDLVRVEGVSGATMTSQAIVQALAEMARQRQRVIDSGTQPRSVMQWSPQDAGTAGVIVGGVLMAFTSLRRRRTVRVLFQLLLIGYLGLINGAMLSQAMLVGWARAGIPWERAGGLVLLTAAALCLPVVTGRNVYCTHLCPHGAVQQLTRSRLPWRLQLSRRLARMLRLVPAALLCWCVVVAMTGIGGSLVDIEPFDAWLFRITGWASLLIAMIGLLASLLVPMAYCRFGCPTGALLGWLRFNGRSDRWSRRDWFALALVLLAAGIHLMS